LIATRRQDHNQLGIAVQLGTVRFLGTFLEDPSEVPAGVVGHATEQLGAAGLLGEVGQSFEGLKLYRDGEARWDRWSTLAGCRDRPPLSLVSGSGRLVSFH
jgi:Domain of unknown function (DUF4158)